MILHLLGNELLKTYRKWRTFIGFIAVGVIVPAVEFALLWEGGTGFRATALRSLEQDFLFVGNLFNGYLITHSLMNSLWVHIPFLITLVAGDQLAGEATAGTVRLLLIRPPSRTAIVVAKYVTTLLYTASLVIFLGALSLGLGLLLFGSGELIVPMPERLVVILAAADVPARFLLAFALAVWSMWCVASLAFLFSSLVENAIGPIVGTMAVVIVFLIVSTLPVDGFASVKPWLFTTYLPVWQQAFADPVPWEEIARSSAILGAHSIGFYLVTWYIFVRKDVLS
jgi:ABC-2 type transport system permease protein